MTIEPLTKKHLPGAETLLREKLKRAERVIPELPETKDFYPLDYFVERGTGVCALDGNELLGYLCWYGPFENAFGSTKTTGVFSPLHGSATVENSAGEICARMYEAAATLWVSAGALSHSICLFTSEKGAISQLFRYGFGLRCVDAIKKISCSEEDTLPEGVRFLELDTKQFLLLDPLEERLVVHLEQSPTFLCYPKELLKSKKPSLQGKRARFFAALKEERPIGYLKLSDEGENFICDRAEMQNICGAYLLPEYRGQGMMDHLLHFVENTLAREGVTLLGVDYESLNPTAGNYWPKHFAEYTYGLTRRVDENVLKTGH